MSSTSGSGAASGSASGARFADAAARALDGASSVPVWLDDPARPARRARLDGDLLVDLAVVGGGLTGLWAAVQAVQDSPARTVAVIEAADLAWAASGRNGGFCAASLTHGLSNGLSRWPQEMPTLLRLGDENLDGFEATIAEHGIDCGFVRSGEITAAVADWQAAELAGLAETARGLGQEVEYLDGPALRALVDSPTYVAGLREERSCAVLDPARLVWGLADVAERAGVTIHERTRVTGMHDEGDLVRLDTTSGRVRARNVVLGTNAFPSPLHRLRPYVVPVWDHVLATEPLDAGRLAAIGWKGREGIGDAGNQFHYYRLTADDRVVFGGYDALYYFGSDLANHRKRNERTERLLAEHLLETFPQLEGVRITHTWGGAIDTCTRFTAFWAQAMGGKLAAVQGYTGLGVGASRFGARVALDLLDGVDNERTRLDMVRKRPVPFPPEPFRWAGIQLTRRSIARADATGGRRDIWLRTLDRLGLGFDS